MTPLELLADYLSTHALREATQKIYLAAVKALLRHFGPLCLTEEIDQRAILAWRKQALETITRRSWNTYATHLRTLWGYALEHKLLPQEMANPFQKTTLIPPRRKKKTVAGPAIQNARLWLIAQAEQEHASGERTTITPAWFWLAVFEVYFHTGIRLNALLCLRLCDVDWERRRLLIRGETEKTHRDQYVPIIPELEPPIRRVQDEARKRHFNTADQLFNVNRFSPHYRRRQNMNIHQVEAMYRKLTRRFGVRMTPHRFRHTLASDLMRHPDRNIHVTKALLNHSNLSTTLDYIEPDYTHMAQIMRERSAAYALLPTSSRVDRSDWKAVSSPTGEGDLPSEQQRQEALRRARGTPDSLQQTRKPQAPRSEQPPGINGLNLNLGLEVIDLKRRAALDGDPLLELLALSRTVRSNSFGRLWAFH
ncbi:recombinase XerC [Pseudomonas protegens]|uniref:Recombinase XerC n=1 Tax=Pseudomonas protegens TaxID=380021 RepID=A0A2T6GD31_9PSED|nr:site-specific integrase [Pseudomonas protegens]PUA42058.1 recombinase XerC [Pseudomonas protegens]